MEIIKKYWPIVSILTISLSSLFTYTNLLSYTTAIIGVCFVICVAYGYKIAPLLGALSSLLIGIVSYQYGYYTNSIVNLLILMPLQVFGYLKWDSMEFRLDRLIRGITFNIGQVLLAIFTIFTVISLAAYSFGSNLWIHDGLTSTLVIIATFLMIGRSKLQWYAWIPYNMIEVIMWFVVASIAPDTLAVLLMRIVFLFNSFIGYYQWKGNQF